MSSADTERMRILQQIEDGEISAAEGLRRLDELIPVAPAAVLEAPRAAGPENAPPDRDLEHWRRWWVLPLYAGLAATSVGALLMYAALSTAGFGVWLVLAAVPFGVGVLLCAAAAGARSAKWLHVRVHTGEEHGPKRIAVSFPLPLRLTGWFLRTFGSRIPQLKDSGVDELILALADAPTTDTPLYIDVQDGAGGERVQVYVG